MRRFIVLATLTSWLSTTWAATPVDLTTWVAANVPSSDSNGSWVLQPGNDAVLQTVNGAPTFFFDPTFSAQGTLLQGNIEVTTFSDDDYIGFAVGLDDGEIGSADANFILIDWKQFTQSAGSSFGTADEGLAIHHVTNASIDFPFWGHDSSSSPGVTQIARGATLGDVGWVENQTFAFRIEFTSQRIQVWIDGNLELDITAADAGLAAFDDGSFALYNYSQSSVSYSVLEEGEVPPEATVGATCDAGELLVLVAKAEARGAAQ